MKRCKRCSKIIFRGSYCKECIIKIAKEEFPDLIDFEIPDTNKTKINTIPIKPIPPDEDEDEIFELEITNRIRLQCPKLCGDLKYKGLDNKKIFHIFKCKTCKFSIKMYNQDFLEGKLK